MTLERRKVLFIDSAIPEEIEAALSRGAQGVTTNPSLVAKAPKGDMAKQFIDRYVDHMKGIAELAKEYPTIDGKTPSLSVEVFSSDPDEMFRQAHEIKKAIGYDNLAIKIPLSYEGVDYLQLIRTLSKEGMVVNATCGFSESQLELAAQAGARFVSLFYNRLIDYFNGLPNSSGDGQERALEIVRDVRKYLDDNPTLESEIIFGSIRKPYDVTNGWKNGAHIVTAGYKVFPGMIQHSGTDASVKGFLDDLEKWKGE
ncbi:MAG: transaldolase family protein [Candidatus Woesearchaeota archaeon]